MTFLKRDFLLCITVLVLLYACSNNPEVAGTISETEGGMLGIVTSSEGIPQSGVAVSLYENLGMDSISDTIATTVTDETGTYHFTNLTSGNYYVEGSLKTDSANFSFRIENVECDFVNANGNPVIVEVENLAVSGYIRGVIELKNSNSGYSGVSVRIKGTGQQTYSNTKGEYVFLQGVHEGDYSLVFEKEGYSGTQYNTVLVNAGDTTEVMTLFLHEKLSSSLNNSTVTAGYWVVDGKSNTTTFVTQ